MPLLRDVNKSVLRKAAHALVWEVPPDRQQRDRGDSVLPHASQASAARMKDFDAIAVAWDELFKRRRKVQPDDTLPITDKDVRAGIWNERCNYRLRASLTKGQ